MDNKEETEIFKSIIFSLNKYNQAPKQFVQ
jgi:hypothetical protein